MSRFLSDLLARSFAPSPAIQPRLASRYEPASGAPSASAAPAFTEEHVESIAPSFPEASLSTLRSMSISPRPAAATEPAPTASGAPLPPARAISDFAIPDFLPRSAVPFGSAPSPRPPAPGASRMPEEAAKPESDRRPPPLATTPPRTLPSRVEDAVHPGDSSPAFPSLFFPRRDPRPSRAPFAPASPEAEPRPPAAPTTSFPGPVTAPVPSSPAPPLLSPPSTPPSVSSVASPESSPAPAPSIQVTIGRVEIRAAPPPPAPARPAASAPARRPALPLEEYLRRRDAA